YPTTDQRMAEYDNQHYKPRGSFKGLLALGGIGLAFIGVGGGVVAVSYNCGDGATPTLRDPLCKKQAEVIQPAAEPSIGIQTKTEGPIGHPTTYVVPIEQPHLEHDRNPATP